MKRRNQKEFRIKSVVIITGDKLYVKWEGYDNLLVGSIKKSYIKWVIFHISYFLEHILTF